MLDPGNVLPQLFTLNSWLSCSYHTHLTFDRSHHTSPTCSSIQGVFELALSPKLYCAGSHGVFILISLSATPGILPLTGSYNSKKSPICFVPLLNSNTFPSLSMSISAVSLAIFFQAYAPFVVRSNTVTVPSLETVESSLPRSSGDPT